MRTTASTVNKTMVALSNFKPAACVTKNPGRVITPSMINAAAAIRIAFAAAGAQRDDRTGDRDELECVLQDQQPVGEEP